MVGVVGSPNYPKLSLVRSLVAQLPAAIVLLTRQTAGVDRTVLEEGARRGLPVELLKPSLEIATARSAAKLLDQAFVRSSSAVFVFASSLEASSPVRIVGLARRLRRPVFLFDRHVEGSDVRDALERLFGRRDP